MDLFRHLHSTGNLWGYIKLLLWRHRRVLAYVVLAAFTALAVYQTSEQSKIRTRDEFRSAQVLADGLAATQAEGSISGCISFNNAVQGMRKVVVGSYDAGQKSIKQFAIEGTLTPPQAKRVSQDSYRTTSQYLSDLKYRDCFVASLRYTEQIKDPRRKRIENQSVKTQVADAIRTRQAEEPHFTRPKG